MNKLSDEEYVMLHVFEWNWGYIYIDTKITDCQNVIKERRKKIWREFNLPENMYGSFWAFTRVTDSSPTKSLFPSCMSPGFMSSETGPTAFPFWKSKTIFFGRTNKRGKSSVSSLVKNLKEVKWEKEGRNWYIKTLRRANNQQREKES